MHNAARPFERSGPSQAQGVLLSIGSMVATVGGGFTPMSMDATGSILLQAAALAVALAATRWAPGSPMRHQL